MLARAFLLTVPPDQHRQVAHPTTQELLDTLASRVNLTPRLLSLLERLATDHRREPWNREETLNLAGAAAMEANLNTRGNTLPEILTSQALNPQHRQARRAGPQTWRRSTRKVQEYIQGPQGMNDYLELRRSIRETTPATTREPCEETHPPDPLREARETIASAAARAVAQETGPWTPINARRHPDGALTLEILRDARPTRHWPIPSTPTAPSPSTEGAHGRTARWS